MEADEGQPPSVEEQRSIQVDNAIRAIREKKPVPEIDFTIHTMEDGTQVNTQERVCKGNQASPPFPTPPHHDDGRGGPPQGFPPSGPPPLAC